MARSRAVIARSSGPPLTSQRFMARIVSPSGSGTTVLEEGNAVTTDDVSSITCAVYDASSDTPSTTVATPSVVVGSAIITLTDDNTWTADPTGYNFQHTIAGSTFSAEEHTYLVVYTVTFVTGDTVLFAFEYYVERVVP